MYVTPDDILIRFDQLESMPVLTRTAPKASLVSVAIIEMIIANYGPLRLSDEVMKEHLKCFTDAKGEPLEGIAFSDTDPRSHKVQFLEHLQKVKPYAMLPSDAIQKEFSVPPSIKKVLFVDEPPAKLSDSVKSFFRPATEVSEDSKAARATQEKKIRDSLPLLIAPKRKIRTGMSQSKLTPKANQLVASLKKAAEKGQVHIDFVENLASYLRGFYLPAMMDVAVAILSATIESREIIPENVDPNYDEDSIEASTYDLPNL